MRVRTPDRAWIVPSDRAVYMPGGTPHALAMHGAVVMCTLYIRAGARPDLPPEPLVMAASDLLQALIMALLEEPVAYAAGSRGERLSRLALEEIVRADPLGLSIPMPQDPRLARICEALMLAPSDDRPLEAWADQAGASGRTLARLFQSQCDLPFARWRQRVRFHHAIAAIGRGQPIAEVARSVGYRSPSAFAAAFRQEVGVTPKMLGQAGKYRAPP